MFWNEHSGRNLQRCAALHAAGQQGISVIKQYRGSLPCYVATYNTCRWCIQLGDMTLQVLMLLCYVGVRLNSQQSVGLHCMAPVGCRQGLADKEDQLIAAC